MADVEDHLTSCPVCFEDYGEGGKRVPRMLHCHHTMCEGCVGDLLTRRKYSVICPECRKQHHAWDGVKTFCQNKYIVSHIRKENARKMELMKENEKAKRKANQIEMSKELCSAHNRESHIYCVEDNCEKPICPWCLKTEHKDHNFEDIHDIKKQKHDKLMATLDNVKENLRQWQKDLRAKDEDVKTIFDLFKTRLTIEKERHTKMVDSMYEHLKKQAYDQLMGDISTDINYDVENAESKIKLVDGMKTKDFSKVKDINAQLNAANKLKEDEKHNQRHQERCIKIEGVKKTLDAVTLSNALTMRKLNYTVIHFISTKCSPQVWSLLLINQNVRVVRDDGRHMTLEIFDFNGELVDSKRLGKILGYTYPLCRYATLLLHVDEGYIVGSNRCRGTLEIMTTEIKVSSVNVKERGHRPGALCVGHGSMLYFVDDSASPRKIIHLDCSEVSDVKWAGFTQTEERQIDDMCCVSQQKHNTNLLITANGNDGISVYSVPNDMAKTGRLVWKNGGMIPGTELEMNALAVAADSHRRVFVCDSANRCIQLFSIDGAYLGVVFSAEIKSKPSAIRWYNDLSYLAIISYDSEDDARCILVVKVE